MRYLRLLRRHGRSLVHAFYVVSRVRVGLSLGSYRSVLSWVEREGRQRSRQHASVPVMVWSVRNVAKVIPGATCLTQAIALRFLLLRAGERSTIRIGVKNGERAQFAAHAWVVYDSRVIIGGQEEELASFVPLIDL